MVRTSRLTLLQPLMCLPRRYSTCRLGLHAFHTVFARKPQAYARLLRALSFELSLPRYRCLRKRFRGVVAEGLSTLTLLCF